MTYIIIGAVTIFIIVIVVLLLQSMHRKKTFEGFSQDVKSIEHIKNQLEHELLRTNKIAKNEESRELFDTWIHEFELYKNNYFHILSLLENMDENNSFATNGSFNKDANAFEGYIFGFKSDFEALQEKVHHYTEYEYDNTRISLQLKTQRKELCALYEVKLKHLGIYHNSFSQSVAEVQVKIDDFEELQKNGEYPEGRLVLKECRDDMENLSHNTKVIIGFMDFLNDIETDITVITKIRDELNKLGYKINIENFDQTIANFTEKNELILNEVSAFDFNKKLDDNEVKTLENKTTTLDEKITSFKFKVEEQFVYIKNIMEFEYENEKLIGIIEGLIAGSVDEKDQIVKLYELSGIEQINKIDTEVQIFNTFQTDYSKLLTIVHEAHENYPELQERIEQANKFLIRLIKNFEVTIKTLKAIRSDELEVRSKIKEFENNVIEIDLYLRKYKHHNVMSRQIGDSITEINAKLGELNREILQEPLNITLVRNLSESIETQIESLIESRLQKNIKQRIGSELILKYISRFNKSDNIDLKIKRLFNLYNDYEYYRLLQEGFGLIESSSPHAKTIYLDIVKQVEVEPFKKIF